MGGSVLSDRLLEIRQHGIPPERVKRIHQKLLDELDHMQARDATKRPRNMAEVKLALQEIKAQLPSQKVKAAAAFTRKLCNETSIFYYIALIGLVLVNGAASIGTAGESLWVISLFIVGGFTSLSSVFKLRAARMQSQVKLSIGERISIVWKQLAVSMPIALLISLLIYCAVSLP